MNINIRLLLIRLVIDSNQFRSISKTESRIARTYTIYIEINSDSITQIISRAFIKEILKD